MTTFSATRFISNILSSTVEKMDKQITEHVINEIPLFRLMEKHGSKKMLDGGLSYTYPLLCGGQAAIFYDPAAQAYPVTHPGAGAFATTGILDLAAVPIYVQGENKWSYVMNDIAITADEELQNMGSSRIVDLISGKLRAAELHFAYKLNTALFSQQLVDRAGAQFMSLMAVAPPIAGDYRSASHTFLCSGVAYDNASFSLVSWKNKYELAQADYSDILEQFLDIRTALSMEGAFKTNVIVLHSGPYKKYEMLAANTIKFAPKDTLDFGFESSTYKGIPMIADDRCLHGTTATTDPSGLTTPSAYFLNLDTFGFFVHSKRNVTIDPLENDPRYMDAKTAKMKFMGGTYCTNRRAQGIVCFSL